MTLDPNSSYLDPGINLDPRTSNLEPDVKPRSSNLDPASNLESVDSKMQLLLEGFSVLDGKIDAVRGQLTERADLTDFKIQVLNDKIDAVASDLKAHRADTEAHQGLYVVKEG